ncbi:leucyl aminopeptidase family protein [Nocardioides sp.]|uniref:leucyl aminopeptidase family protein n=1 Tax=Nocardioides sp. TaxID=35761 RepID=UPI003D0DFFB3
MAISESHAAVLPPQVSPPEFALSALLPHALRGVEALAVPVLPGEPLTLGPGAGELLDLLDLDGFALLEHHAATGAAGEVTTHPVLGRDDLALVAFVGVGDQTPADLRRAGAALARAMTGRASVATTVASVVPDEGFEAFVVGAMLGSFGFAWRQDGPTSRPVAQIVLAGAHAGREAPLTRALALGGAGWRARALATVPSNVKSPQWLADQAQAVADAAGLGFRVWDEVELAAAGFGALVGVGRASATPPRLIQLDYTPRGVSSSTAHVVLVGKGITFDSGGLSIKPGEAMATMKRDMTGGAVVIATLGALAEVGCPVRVTGLIPTAENAISGSALRPGDVVRHYNGRTTEVTNTDAEGRLVLADAMAYAVAELAPDVLVDVATLTGAMKIALGLRTGGYFSNDEALASLIATAGAASGEPLWRFPLASVYEDKLASKVADADNAAGTPGAITAALFLQHFAGDVPWAHLDVASFGDSPTENYEWTTGPTGFGARALLAWLRQEEPLKGVGS